MENMYAVRMVSLSLCVCLQLTAYNKFFYRVCIYFMNSLYSSFFFKKQRRKNCSLNKCFISILFSAFHFKPKLNSALYLIFSIFNFISFFYTISIVFHSAKIEIEIENYGTFSSSLLYMFLFSFAFSSTISLIHKCAIAAIYHSTIFNMYAFVEILHSTDITVCHVIAF